MHAIIFDNNQFTTITMDINFFVQNYSSDKRWECEIVTRLRGTFYPSRSGCLLGNRVICRDNSTQRQSLSGFYEFCNVRLRAKIYTQWSKYYWQGVMQAQQHLRETISSLYLESWKQYASNRSQFVYLESFSLSVRRFWKRLWKLTFWNPLRIRDIFRLYQMWSFSPFWN